MAAARPRPRGRRRHRGRRRRARSGRGDLGRRLDRRRLRGRRRRGDPRRDRSWAPTAWSRTAPCSASAPRLRPGSSAAGSVGALVVADGATVCCGAVLYAGARVETRGDHRRSGRVRERAVVGAAIRGRARLDRRLRRHGRRARPDPDRVYVTGGSVVEDDVFIGPGVTTTNDHTMGRHAAGEPLLGPVLRRACRVGGGVVLTPGGRDRRGGVRRRRRRGGARRGPARGRDGRAGPGRAPGRRRGPARALA